MRKGFEKALILSLSIAVVLLITAGCQEQSTTTQKATIKVADNAGKPVVVMTEVKQTSDKMGKMLAAGNIDLKQQVTTKDKEIERLKQELNNCQVEKAAAGKNGDKDLSALGEEVVKAFEANTKLHEENDNLKKQIGELKALATSRK